MFVDERLLGRELTFAVVVIFVVYVILTDPLQIQPWSQDRRNQSKLNRKQDRKEKAGKAEKNVYKK